MITAGLILNNLRLILIIALVGAVIWFWKDYNYQKNENKRLEFNMTNVIKKDSLKYSELELNKEEIEEYFKYNNQELVRKLDEQNIKLNRIQRVISQKQTYTDTIKKVTVYTGFADKVKNNIPVAETFTDSTKCLIIKGKLIYDGKEVSISLTDRKFESASDVVAYWERKNGIFGTKLFGKKEITIKTFNSCGQTETFVINNSKMLKK